MNIVAIDPPKNNKTNTQTSEHFELLAFDRQGYLSIQTNQKKYFYADSFFYAARDLMLLLNGDTANLSYGIAENRITDPEAAADKYLCVDLPTLQNALTADEITSNHHPRVVKFFTLLLGMNKL